MHHLRRAVFRAASSSPSVSFIPQTRSITSTSPFLLRSKVQAARLSPSAFRRFASSDATSPESADSENSAVSSAIGSAEGSATTYTGEAADSLSGSAEQTSHGSADAAAARAAGRAFEPREDGQRGPARNVGNYGDRSGGFEGRYNDRERSPAYGRREMPEPVPNPTIYIGNILFDITEKDLETEFSAFGIVRSVIIARDGRGLSKGFGYIAFETTDQATAAIEAKHNSFFEGRRIVINYSNKTTTTKKTAPENPPSKTLFLGNLAFEMSDADINELFRDVRNVIDVRVAIDRRTGQPRGFAHAEFVDTESATKAMNELLGKEMYGRRIRFDYSAGVERRSRREATD